MVGVADENFAWEIHRDRCEGFTTVGKGRLIPRFASILRKFAQLIVRLIQPFS